MIKVGDTVEFRNFYRCEVLDILDGGFIRIRPYCDAFVVCRPSDVKIIKRV